MKDRYRKEPKRTKKKNKIEEKRQLELEYRRNALKPKKETEESAPIPRRLSASLRKQLKDALDLKKLPRNLLGTGSPERGIIKNQLIPAAVELVAGDDPEIEVEVKENSSDENENN